MYITTPKDTVWLCDRCVRPGVDERWYIGAIGVESLCHRCGMPTPGVYDIRCEEIQRVHLGGVAFTSTSEGLQPVSDYVYDVNRYYAHLGVSTDASMAEIMAGFYANDGMNSERLTYIVKWLRNPEQRAYYDRLVPPEILFDMFYRRSVEAEIAARKLAATEANEDTSHWEKIDLSAMEGKKLFVKEDSPDGIDSERRANEDVQPLGADFFLWQSNRRDGGALAVWRAHLSGHLRQRGDRMLAVGYHGATDQPVEVVRPPAYSVPVFLLHEEQEPSDALAAAAVSRVEMPAVA